MPGKTICWDNHDDILLIVLRMSKIPEQEKTLAQVAKNEKQIRSRTAMGLGSTG
jgi:hypothetical protein